MKLEVTQDELKELLADPDVQAIIFSKMQSKLTTELAGALTAQYKSLGVDSSASASNESANESGTDGTSSSEKASA